MQILKISRAPLGALCFNNYLRVGVGKTKSLLDNLHLASKEADRKEEVTN